MKLEARLSEAFDLSKIDANGTLVSFDAALEERAQLTETLGIEGVESLAGEIHIRPWRKTGFMLDGTMMADVIQTCVITLDPVRERVEARFEQAFLPASDDKGGVPDVEVDFNLETEDPPDVLEGHTLDLLAVLGEHLALNLDPYPRLPGARVDPAYQDEGEAGEKENPFAALKVLKGKEK